jgi:hypothetical protein
LFKFLEELERSDARVTASPHLARAYGHPSEIPAAAPGKSEGNYGFTESEEAVPEPNGWRSGREVVVYLRSRGAGVRMVRRPEEWATLSSEGEGGEEALDEGVLSS